METTFSRTLSLLRSERGLSQRATAKDLGISQALMSHYENGAREPGLAFVAKVCDYYHVSADYMLGRTTSPDGTIIDPEVLYDSSEEKSTLKGSIIATLQKKLVANSASVLFDLLAKCDNREAIVSAGNFMTASIYQLLRTLYSACGGDEKLFSVDQKAFQSGVIDADIQLSRCQYNNALATDESLPALSSDDLTSIPSSGQSVAQIIHATDERASQHLVK